MKNKINVLKRTVVYDLDNGKEMIIVHTHRGPKVSVFDRNGQPDFMFKLSSPERVDRIAKMFIKAADLASKEDYE